MVGNGGNGDGGGGGRGRNKRVEWEKRVEKCRVEDKQKEDEGGDRKRKVG